MMGTWDSGAKSGGPAGQVSGKTGRAAGRMPLIAGGSSRRTE